MLVLSFLNLFVASSCTYQVCSRKKLALASMGEVVLSDKVNVVEAPDIVISEYIGRVASKCERLSACVVTVRQATCEPVQTPEFDEYVMVLEGQADMKLLPQGHTVHVKAGQGVYLPAGQSVQWSWPDTCRYVPICLPAFSPANCHRADDGGQYAKTSTSMRRLKQLHEEQKHPFLYHCAQKAVWEKCKADNKTYYPPTYKQDGFTHATADGSKLLGVLNHFYKDVPGEWVCLKFTRKSLAIAGVDVVFEEPAPVGDTPAIDSGGQLFPHLMGGIPTATGVVLDELPILRAPGGGFQSIPGVTEPRESDSVGQSAPQHQRIWAGSVAASFWCGLAVGAALTVGLCVMAGLTPSLLGKFNSKR